MDRDSKITVSPDGYLEFLGKRYCCAIGRGGVVTDKREGDGSTPAGCFYLRRLYYRSDRLGKPETGLETVPLEPNFGWSNDPDRPEYNTLVKLPYDGRHEKLWHKDNLYDLIVTISHNAEPPEPGKGSAIFIHLARPEYSPTDGCIALSLPDLLDVLRKSGVETRVCVHVGI